MLRRIQEEFNEWFLERMGDIDDQEDDGRLCPKGVEHTHFNNEENLLTLTAFDGQEYYIDLTVLEHPPCRFLHKTLKRPRNEVSATPAAAPSVPGGAPAVTP